MNKGKTNYKFQINCTFEIIDKTIKEWLKENKFSFENKYGEDFYYYYDAWNGNRGFQYTINNNEVNIYAWTIGIGKQFYMLDSGAVNNMAGDSYKNLLSDLFNKLNNLNMATNITTNNNENNYGTLQSQSISQVANDLKTETTNKAEKSCEIGFWLSIVGLFLPFFGYAFGIILYILVFYLAIQGLKTKKRLKSIISIILSIISILITIVMFIS